MVADLWCGAFSISSIPAAAAGAGSLSTSSDLKVSVSALSFADQQVKTSSHPKTVTVTNEAAAPVTIASIAVAGDQPDDFAQSNDCGSAIARNASCKIQVAFKPSSVGAKSASLNIADSAGNSPQRVALEGTGVVTVFGVSTSKLTVTAGPTASMPYPAIGLTIKNPNSSRVFYNAKFSGPAVMGVNIQWNAAPINGLLSGNAELQVDMPNLQGSGTFVSTVILSACLDSACTKPLSGSPQRVTVTYVVTGNAIPAGTFSLLPTSLNFEVPSNGSAPPATFDLTADDLPPYEVYVTTKSQSSKVIRSMHFSGFPTTGGYANGLLTVNFAPPGQLGPGIYQNTITLSVCYDIACKKPAVGSPWLIPITYTVTASVGREFQQRILPISAVAIAADPSGSYIYLADWEYTQTDQANLIKLNPSTGSTLSSVPLDGPPGLLSISSDGKYAYVAVTLAATGTQEIERIALASMSVDLRIALPLLDLEIANLAVSPVNSHTLALAYSYLDPTAGPYLDVALFDDGVKRPKILSTVPDNAYGNNIQWRPDGTQLYIRGPATMSVSVVEPDGLDAPSAILASVYGDGFFGADIHEQNGLLYSDGGGVLDLNTHAVLGR